MKKPDSPPQTGPLRFHGGVAGSIAPFALFVAGVVAVALSGAPNETGFWPVLVAALSLGLLLARDRGVYCEAVLEGMARKIVVIMIMAWLLSSTVGVLLRATGFVDSLVWSATQLELGPVPYVAASFLICCAVSTSTGTSLGTILICGPLLYPAGVALGAPAAPLAGAILGGATFGDSISPISDTTIASALTQEADIGGTVGSRLKYVVPAVVAALGATLVSAAWATTGDGLPAAAAPPSGDPKALPMVLAPAVILFLLLRGRHLLHGLLAGLMTGTIVGLALGLLPFERVLSLDPVNFTARSFMIDGIQKGVGISIFTLLLVGLVSGLEAGGALGNLVDWASRSSHGTRSAEAWIAASAGLASALTTHSIVAILTVGEFAKETGRRFRIHRYRRANLLDLTVVVLPFLLPYCIPVILAYGITASDTGRAAVSPLAVGMHNFYSWSVLAALVLAIATGFGSETETATATETETETD